MSAYCSTTEVNSLLKSITISASGTKISTAEVDAMIIRISNTMDGRVVKKYTLPVADTEALSILKDVCMKFSAAEVLRILYAGGMVAVPAIAKTWHDEAEKVMEGIEKGTFKLEAADSSDIVHTGTLDEDGNEREPTMTKEMEF